MCLSYLFAARSTLPDTVFGCSASIFVIMDPRSVRITDDRLCSLFRRNFFATRADSPPVEADPATNSVMVAIHAGHITFLLLLRSHLSFSYPILFHFNHTTKEPSRFRTAISTLFARGVRRSPFAVRRSPFAVRRSPFAVRRSAFGVRRSAAAQSQAMVQVQDIGNTLKAKSWRKGRYTIRQSPDHFPGRRAAATWCTCARHSRNPPARGAYG
jgi:hypothetical protein